MKAGKDNYYGYNRHLRTRAVALRKRMTKAEACLWKYVLKSRKMKGYSFRRQRPVLNYIADFMCKELMLIIETDGFIHLSAKQQARDRIRQAKLEKAGFTVIRFWNEEVLQDIGGVMERLERWVEEREGKPPLRSGKSESESEE